jgi:hypothetical protein
MTVDERPVVAPDPVRTAAADSIVALIDATNALRSHLDTQEALCRAALVDILDDVPVSCVLPGVRADTWRPTLTEAIKGFEVVRHRSRLLLVAMAIDEGMSIAEVARAWGVSRQLASRWVREARSVRG